MRKTIIRPEPLELDVETMNGETITLRVTSVTSQMIDDVRTVARSEETLIKSGTSARKQLAVIFGHDEQFYAQFDIVVLLGILKAFNEYTETPMRTQGN